MRTRHAVIIMLVALALLVFAGVRFWHTATPASLRPGTQPHRIEIRRPREDVILTRDPNGPWIVARQDDLADTEAVNQLLSGLSVIKFGPPVASPAAGPASGLGPADSSRVRVLDQSGRPLFDGRFGRRLFGLSIYFQENDHKSVRLATGVDPDLLQRSSAQWREPRLLPGGCPGGLEILTHETWRALSNAEAVQALCTLRASHWATGTLAGLAGFERPLLRARTQDGRGFTVGERRGNERLVRIDGRNLLLRIPAAPIEAAAADLIRSRP